MKEKLYADVDAIQKASTAILNAIPKDALKKSFDNLFDCANRCILCEYLQQKTNFLFFYKVLQLLNSSLYIDFLAIF